MPWLKDLACYAADRNTWARVRSDIMEGEIQINEDLVKFQFVQEASSLFKELIKNEQLRKELQKCDCGSFSVESIFYDTYLSDRHPRKSDEDLDKRHKRLAQEAYNTLNKNDIYALRGRVLTTMTNVRMEVVHQFSSTIGIEDPCVLRELASICWGTLLETGNNDDAAWFCTFGVLALHTMTKTAISEPYLEVLVNRLQCDGMTDASRLYSDDCA